MICFCWTAELNELSSWYKSMMCIHNSGHFEWSTKMLFRCCLFTAPAGVIKLCFQWMWGAILKKKKQPKNKCLNTQSGFIIEWLTTSMPSNMSIKAYAEVAACAPSNCKQILCGAHVTRCYSLFLTLLPFLWYLFISASLSPCNSPFMHTPKPAAATKSRAGLPCSQVG